MMEFMVFPPRSRQGTLTMGERFRLLQKKLAPGPRKLALFVGYLTRGPELSVYGRQLPAVPHIEVDQPF